MSRNDTSSPAATKPDKLSPIMPIQISNRSTVSKITTTTNFQYDNIHEENNDNADRITVEPRSPKTNKRQNTLSGLSPKPKQSTSTRLQHLNRSLP